jgi:hypothetical protein
VSRNREALRSTVIKIAGNTYFLIETGKKSDRKRKRG